VETQESRLQEERGRSRDLMGGWVELKMDDLNKGNEAISLLLNLAS
jgi:hypothetical protein